MRKYRVKKYLILHPERYDEKLKEVTVLIKSGTYFSKSAGEEYRSMSVSLYAYVDAETDTLMTKRTSLTWDSKERRRKRFRLREEQIYKLLVRESLPTKNAVGDEIEGGRNLFVVKMLKRKCSEPRLEKLREEYKIPVKVSLSDGTELTLNRKNECYEGVMSWPEGEAEFSLDIDAYDLEASTAAALKAAERLCTDKEAWDKRVRTYAAAEMTENANDWQEGSGEEPITEEAFAKRIGMPFITLSHTGDLQFMFDDDNMFWSHVVVVLGDIEAGFNEATIWG